jgi:two-component system NtrC family response regulator
MGKPRILIIDDDKHLREELEHTLETQYEVLLSEDGRDILKKNPNVILLDLHLPPDITTTKVGMSILRDLVDMKLDAKVIVITGSNDRKDALAAIDMGVCDYINKPINIDELETVLKRAVHIYQIESENRKLQQRLGRGYIFEDIVGNCPQMQHIFSTVRRVAPTNSTVLLQGETGTGKELIARAIHRQSFRKENPFIAINCAAIPDTLLESELFGYEKGSFTGAYKKKLGSIELAHGGTLFLDEIVDLPLPLQPKILRFLQGLEIQRIGGKERIKADVRIIAASNSDLREAVKMGSFRKDLYYRLKLIVIELPPLRDRGEDILLLAEHFLRRMSRGLKVKRFTSGAKKALLQYAWPGNVRELQNKIERAAIISSGRYISKNDLELYEKDTHIEFPLKRAKKLLEREYIAKALSKSKGNITWAAKMLGMDQKGLRRLMIRHGMNKEEYIEKDGEVSGYQTS